MEQQEKVDSTKLAGEEAVWTGTPSQVVNFWTYVLCVLFCWLIVPIFIGLWKWIVVKSRQYELTTQRLLYTTGVFNKHRDQIEIYRIKDIRVEEPFFLRLFGAGNIVLDTSDKTTPIFILQAVSGPRELADRLRELVEKRRTQKGVRELDME